MIFQKNKIKSKLSICNAFTLSEVMIAMVMVGILVALVTPTITNLTPDSNKIMIKKAYSTLENAISEMAADETNYPSDQTGTDSDSATVMRVFNYTTATTNGTTNKFCYFLADKLNILGSATCPLASASATTTNFATTSDGVIWYIYLNNSDANYNFQFPLNPNYYYTKILIDVNGTKTPNCTADINGNTYSFNYLASCTNPDRFIVGIRYDGKLQIGCSTLPSCATITDQKVIDILSDPTNNTK